MLRVAAVYGEPMNAQHMRELVTIIAGGLFMRYLAEAAAKVVPFGGDLVAGAIAAAATWSIGQVAIEYFESGKKLTPARSTPRSSASTGAIARRDRKRSYCHRQRCRAVSPRRDTKPRYARLACGEGTGMLWAERHVAKCSFGHGTHAAAAEVASPTLGVLRLVSPASNEIAFLDGGHAVPITRGINPIGRAQRNAIVLLDPSVSREHARLIASREGWWIENCSTANTLEVAGQACQPGQGMALSPGDIVRLGQTSLQLVALRPTYPDSTSAEGLLESSEGSYAAYLAEATGESNGFLPDEVSEADLLDDVSDDVSDDASLPQSASSTHLLSPGITLQFAFRGRFRRACGGCSASARRWSCWSVPSSRWEPLCWWGVARWPPRALAPCWRR